MEVEEAEVEVAVGEIVTDEGGGEGDVRRNELVAASVECEKEVWEYCNTKCQHEAICMFFNPFHY